MYFKKNLEKGESRFGYLWIALKYFQQDFNQSQQRQQKESQPRKLSAQISVNSSGSPYSSPNLKSVSSPSFQNSLSSSHKFPFGYSNTLQSGDLTSQSYSVNQDESAIKMCNEIIKNFDNPYLKALFTYLLNKEESIMKLLVVIFMLYNK